MMFELSSDTYKERCQKLVDAAKAYEDHGNEIYAAHMPTAMKRKHDGQARLAALTIGNAFRTLFEQSKYGLTAKYGMTAKITSVVTGREIKSGTVVKWLTPVFSAPKNSA